MNTRPIAALVAPALATLAGCGGPSEPSEPSASPEPSDAAPGAPERSDPFPPPADSEWVPLFDGASLDGWTPKFAGAALGEDPLDTFRVEDGVLAVRYDRYEEWGGRFGHLFTPLPFEHFRLRAEYRFVGEQVAGAPGWAWRNNGLMLFCQDPASIGVDQPFPVSIECQLLAGDGESARPTAGVCSPGTAVTLPDGTVPGHCHASPTAPTLVGDGWVTTEVLVLGPDRVRHFVDGALVLEYGDVRLDPEDADARALIDAGADPTRGPSWFAIQAESTPIEFRRIDVLPLGPLAGD